MQSFLFSLLLLSAFPCVAACDGEVTSSDDDASDTADDGDTTSGGEPSGSSGSTGGDGTCSAECLACCNDPSCPAEAPEYFGAPCSDDGLLCYYDDGTCEVAWQCGYWELDAYAWASHFEQIHCPAPYVPDCESAKDGDACPYPGYSCGGEHCETFSASCGDDHVWQVSQLPCEDDCTC